MHNNKTWLDLVWRLISEHFTSLSPFADLKLIQYDNTRRYSLDYVKSSKARVKFFFVETDCALDKHVLAFLQQKCHFNDPNAPKNLLGCILFNEEHLSPHLRQHIEFNQYFLNIRAHSLVDIFLLLNEHFKVDMKTYTEKNMTVECKVAIGAHLNSIKFENDAFFLIARTKLPIFRVFNTKEFITAEQSNYFRVEKLKGLNELPLDPQIKLIDSSEIENLAIYLKLAVYPISELLEKSIDYHAKSNNFDKILPILEWNFLNNFDDKQNLLNKLLLKTIYRNNNPAQSNLLELSSIYDPNDLYVKLFVPQTFQLHVDLSREPFYSKLAGSLKKQIEQTHFVEFVARMENNGNDENYLIQGIKHAFKYLSQFEDDSEVQTTRLIQSCSHLKWLPCAKSCEQLYKASQLWSPECAPLVGQIRPIVDSNLVPSRFMSTLKINSKSNVTLELVGENLANLIQNHQLLQCSEVIEPIYAYLSEYFHKDASKVKVLCESFVSRRIPFVYDGHSRFFWPAEVIFNSHLANLEPFYATLNGNLFAKKFRELYVVCFGVYEELEIVCLLDLLEKIRDDVTGDDDEKMSETKKITLVNLIFGLIETTYLDELVESDELRSRLLLPVRADRGVEFERPGKCVYLMETEESEGVVGSGDEDFKVKSCKQKG